MTRNAARVLVGTAFVDCSVGRLSRGKNRICMDLGEGSNWLRTGFIGGHLNAVAVMTFRVALSDCFDSRCCCCYCCWQLHNDENWAG